MSGVAPFTFLVVLVTIALAVLAAGLRWRVPVRPALPMPTPKPIDGDAHTLTYLGADGRPNPLQYETFSDYPSALARQRDQTRQGHPSVVVHTESGEVRVDPYEMFGPFRRISF